MRQLDCCMCLSWHTGCEGVGVDIHEWYTSTSVGTGGYCNEDIQNSETVRKTGDRCKFGLSLRWLKLTLLYSINWKPRFWLHQWLLKMFGGTPDLQNPGTFYRQFHMSTLPNGVWGWGGFNFRVNERLVFVGGSSNLSQNLLLLHQCTVRTWYF